MVADALPVPVAVAPAREDSSLGAVRWQRRVLVVFSATSSDARLTEQRALTRDAASDFRDRDLIVVEVVGDSVAGVRDYAPRLRAKYGISADAFAVVLIGKDGATKLRSRAPLRPATLFATIDAMPMRRSEMQAR